MENKALATTHGIVHAGFSGLRRFVSRKKRSYKLIGNRLVIPHDTIPSTLWVIPKGLANLLNDQQYCRMTLK